MNFQSILFNEPADSINVNNAETPPFFVDLNLDQIVDAITIKWAGYGLPAGQEGLKNFFYSPLSNIDSIQYRHEVFKELENLPLYESIKLFAEQMNEVRKYLKLVEKLYYQNQKEIWLLYAAEYYCSSVKKITDNLSTASLKSRGFLGFSEYLKNYTSGKQFTSLENEINTLKVELSKVKYRIIIKDNSFTVQNYEPGINYSAEIEAIFQKFKQGAVKDYLVKYNSVSEDMNHIEAKILDFVEQLNSNLFSELENFCIRYANLPTGQAGFIDGTIAVFDREIYFYIAYLEHISKFKHNKLQFCYPQISNTSKEIYDYDGFDLALARKLNENNGQIVCNDFYLKDKERIIVVTGPNQGGKTTFARIFGQLHYLASIGCPVPGREAQLFFFDNIFTQFERSEKVENLRGKLEDDLTRIHLILEQATSRSILIMNEIFNSTTLQDVSFLSTKIIEKILELDLLCVWVTFIDELASFSKQTVSMTSTVVPENPALRTFKVIRRRADGLAFALAIAEKYQLTYRHITERIKS